MLEELELERPQFVIELEGRPCSVAARTGYFLQGMRPDVVDAIMGVIPPPRSRVRFGTCAAIRNDERWHISDSTPPFDPRETGKVR